MMRCSVHISPGLRVVRGPDWSWGEQDGGEGHLGTVAEVESVSGQPRMVVVQWDRGGRCRYRCGQDDKYDLRAFDSAQSGLRFPDHVCNGCHVKGVVGFLWKCIQCFEYHLCTLCYMADKHTSRHKFDCYLTKQKHRWRVSARATARKVMAGGFFPGAVVVRGHDWRWKDQDGGPGKLGKLLEVKDWRDDTARSVSQVEWRGSRRKNVYRTGHNGKVDLKCMVAGNGGHYFPEHLPVLGVTYPPPGLKDFASGDKIKAQIDMDIFQSIGAVEGLASQIGLMLDSTGTVNSFLDSGDLLVRYPSNSLFPISPEAATKVDSPAHEIGDVVRIMDDMAEMYRLQKDHGGWNDDMALALGQLGRVVKEFPSGDLSVTVNGKRWTVNPNCVLPAPGEELPPDEGEGCVDLEYRLKLFTLSQSMSSQTVVIATAAGDIAQLRRYLEKCPHEVNAKYEGKTGAHVAIEEGNINALRVLMDFNANLELEDGDGEKPLHTCAFVNRIDAARMLLDAGVNINTTNRKGNTPLMVCAAVGHHRLLKLFVAQPKLNQHIQDQAGCTALHHAVVAQRTKSVMILMQAGADPAVLSHRCSAAVHDAAGFGFIPAMEEFVHYNPEHVNLRRPDSGYVPLHIACNHSRLDMVKFILETPSCEANAKNDLGRTALQMTAIEGHSNIIELLVGYGMDLNCLDTDGHTPIHVIMIKKSVKPLSADTPQMNKVRDDLLALTGRSTIPPYFVVACFLGREGSNLHLKSRRGQNAIQMCPDDLGTTLLNFVNQCNRGEYFGSLLPNRQQAQAEVINNPLARNQLPFMSQGQSPTATEAPLTITASVPPGPAVNGPPSQTPSGPALVVNPPPTEMLPTSKTAVSSPPSQKVPASSSSTPAVSTPPSKTPSGPTTPSTSTVVNSSTSKADTGPFDKGPCFLCERPIDVSLEPCGHSIACGRCATQAKRCPLCKSPVRRVVKHATE